MLVYRSVHPIITIEFFGQPAIQTWFPVDGNTVFWSHAPPKQQARKLQNGPKWPWLGITPSFHGFLLLLPTFFVWLLLYYYHIHIMAIQAIHYMFYIVDSYVNTNVMYFGWSCMILKKNNMLGWTICSHFLLGFQWRGVCRVYQELIIYSNAELPGALKALHKGRDSREGNSWTEQLLLGFSARRRFFCVFCCQTFVCFLGVKGLDDLEYGHQHVAALLSLSAQHKGGPVALVCKVQLKGLSKNSHPHSPQKCIYVLYVYVKLDSVKIGYQRKYIYIYYIYI